MNERNLNSQTATVGVDAPIGIGNEGAERRSYHKPALRRLGLLREHTARRASPGVTVTHDSGTGADTFSF